MCKPYLFFLILLPLLFLAGCKSPSSGTDAVPYSPYVEAFTSGKVSRFAPVYLVFNEEIAPEKMQAADIGKYAKIKPDVRGTFSFENSKTIVFKPETELARDTEYKVTIDMSPWFDVENNERQFIFQFSTLPLVVRANLKSVDVSADNNGTYDITYSLYTPDRETPETIQSLIAFSEKVETAWEHPEDGKNHTLTVRNLPARNTARALDLSVGTNKLGAKEEKLLSTSIPALNDFSVYDVKYVSEPERYVEVTFTDALDETQNMEGLAIIVDNQNQTVTVSGNKLRLYPDNKRVGEQIIHLHESIKAKGGRELGENVEETVIIFNSMPDVSFVGSGTIIPLTSELTVPFHAVYLRGVIVRVIKVLEQNVGQFLQTNSIGGSNNLMQVGRLVCRKTIFLDEEGANLMDWKTYALHLNDLIDPEPGAIYRIEMTFTRDLSVFPCDTDNRKTKEEIIAEDEIKFKEESEKFDNGGYYYYYGEVDYDYYEYYEERDNPCSDMYYYNKVRGTNILATNLGLMAKRGEGNEMTVLVHNIMTTMPERGVNVSLYNYQHQVVGTGTTDDKGQAHITLSQGKPFYLIASQGKQRSYMRIDQGSALSLSSFDVSGEVVQKGIKGFIYGDRGVWRPGDTLFLSFMLNDRLGTLPAGHPVIMELTNPLGQSYLKKTQTKGEMGVYAFAMPTESDAPTGAWNVSVQVGGVTFSKSVRIETIKPNRLKIDLTLPEKPSLQGEVITIPLHTEWMQGAVARNLNYDMQASFASVPTSFKNYTGYVFDDPSKIFQSEESDLVEGQVDNEGNATITARFNAGNSSPGMLTANLTTRVYEESGEFSIDGASIPYSPYKRYIGIKSPQTSMVQLVTDKDHTFELVSLDYEGKPSPTKIEVHVYRVSWHWWWNSTNQQLASYVHDHDYSPTDKLTVTTGADGKGTFTLNKAYGEWGTYLIRAIDDSGNHSTGIMSYFDWPTWGALRGRTAENSSPTLLSFKTDKENYAPGEKMKVTFPSPAGSRAVVSIENGSKILATSEHLCQEGETTLELDVTPDMQPNAYVYVTLLQPYAHTGNDLPIRLYGVAPFGVSAPESYLHPVIGTANEFKPEEQYTVTVSEEKGRPMAYTLAIVDEGLLDLTRFPTPDPWKAFNAREALGVSSWDLYNNILGAYGGRIEQLFSIGGDDDLKKGPKAIVNRFKPVVRFEGPFLLKKGEKKRHTYMMPNYNGRVRVMVVAGDGSAYGKADKSVFVRKPVMLLGTLPRIIGIGEEMAVPATVFATEDNVGNVKVTIQCSDNMEVVGNATQELNFKTKEDKQALFRIRVKDQAGAAKVTITATGKGEKSVYETDIEIRSVRQPVTQVEAVTLAGGQNWDKAVSLPGLDGTNTLTLEVSDVPPLNISSRLQFLLGYPHGCLEQITSKAFPQLYLKEFASLTSKQESELDRGVKSVIGRYRSYQMADGGFAYWSGGSSLNSWGSIYATHFMVEAGSKGYMVPASLRTKAIAFLKKEARNWKGTSDSHYYQSEEMVQSYRLYVLALAQQAELGAMNRMKEIKALNNTSRWMLAASYALVGRNDVATELVTNTIDANDVHYSSYDYTYGSDFRDLGIRLQTLSLLKRGDEAAQVTKRISEVLSSERWLSTQETSFAFIGVSAYMNKYKTGASMSFAYACNGKSASVKTGKNVWSETLFEKGGTSARMELKNEGNSTLFVCIIKEGTPEQGTETAYANKVAIDVAYQDGSGRVIDISQLPQGINFSAVVTVRNPTSQPMQNLVLTQVFPAGWEILNTRFLHEGTTPAMTDGISYQDIRDDRVYTYIDNLREGRQVTVRINLATVYAGRFYLPPVYCEAMYDNLTQANTEGKQVTVE